MSKFFCSTRDKNVNVQVRRIRSTTNEDSLEQYKNGTKVCFEAQNGYCFEHENCPLRHK